jgi:pimeloyl-ACP methyl ester carboxylesterase
MMCDGRLWHRITAQLAAPLQHALPVGADTIAGLAAGILATAPPRFALAGLSLGGIVAMEILRQAPERVERVALMDTNPYAEADAVKARRAGQIARALSGDLIGVMRDEMKPNYLAPGGDPSILDLCLSMALDLGAEVFRDQSIALRDRPDQQEAVARYKGPTLILMGAEDRLCPRDRHERLLALMPRATFAVIEGAGHLPPLERPEATLRALNTWLAA